MTSDGLEYTYLKIDSVKGVQTADREPHWLVQLEAYGLREPLKNQKINKDLHLNWD